MAHMAECTEVRCLEDIDQCTGEVRLEVTEEIRMEVIGQRTEAAGI
jgi:hypothetical protein